MRTFITSIPLQIKGKLYSVVYEPIGFEMEGRKKTAFPIIPIIEQEMGKSIDGKDEVVVLKLENPAVENNYKLFLEELAELGILEEQVKTIIVPMEQTTDNGIRMILDILENVSDDSDVYACVTFGTKVMSTLETFALIFLEKLKVNCRIQGMFYGEIRWRDSGDPEEGWLYNLTSNLRLNRIVDRIQSLEMADAERFFREILEG